MALLGSVPNQILTPPPTFLPIKTTPVIGSGDGPNAIGNQQLPLAKSWSEGGVEHKGVVSAATQIKALLERYKQLANHEYHLVAQLKEQNPRSPAGQQLGRQLQFILAQKIREVNTLVGDQLQPKELKSAAIEPVVASVVPALAVTPGLEIIEQPPSNVVANKYLEPSIILKVHDQYLMLAKDSRLQVSATLYLALSDKPILRTLDDKQDILQGHVSVLVGGDGIVTFNKLKIMEVSSKYQHQAFRIHFQLEEIKAGSLTSALGSPVKSLPLHVQSRVNKRKKLASSDGIETFSNSPPTKKIKAESTLSKSTDSLTDDLSLSPSLRASSGGISTRSSLRNSLGNGVSPVYLQLR